MTIFRGAPTLASASLVLHAALAFGVGPVITDDSISYQRFDAVRSAGYPIYLHAVRLAGGGTLSAVLLQCALFVGATLLLAHALRPWVPAPLRLGLVAALALNPALVYFNLHLQTESLQLTLSCTAIALLLDRFAGADGPVRSLALGAVIGAAVALRPASVYLVALPWCAAWLAGGGARAALPGLVFQTLALVGVLAAAGAYHGLHHERGASLLPAHAFARGLMLIGPDDRTVPAPELAPHAASIAGLNARVRAMDGFSERFLAMTRLENLYQHHAALGIEPRRRLEIGLALIRDHPLRYAALSAEHLVHLWTADEVMSPAGSQRYWNQVRTLARPAFVPEASWTGVLVKRRRTFPLAPARAALPALGVLGVLATLAALRSRLGRGRRSVRIELAGLMGAACLAASATVALTGLALLRYTIALGPWLATMTVLLGSEALRRHRRLNADRRRVSAARR